MQVVHITLAREFRQTCNVSSCILREIGQFSRFVRKITLIFDMPCVPWSDESPFARHPSVPWSDESPPAFRSDDSPPVPSVKTVGTITQRQFATDRSKRNMKTFQISEDRVVVVKKNLVTIKQKDSDKSFEFTPSRLVLCTFVTKILY